MVQTLRVSKSASYDERRQAAFDQLVDTYEEDGIPVGSGEFKINHMLALMMARRAFREEYGVKALKWININADELPGTEVHPGVYITRTEDNKYYLEYEDAYSMEQYIQEWV